MDSTHRARSSMHEIQRWLRQQIRWGQTGPVGEIQKIRHHLETLSLLAMEEVRLKTLAREQSPHWNWEMNIRINLTNKTN